MRFCSECGASYGDNTSFSQHFIEQHLRLQHLCTVCGQTFDTQKEFTEHVLAHSNELMSLECASCHIAFESRELLAMHVQLVHDRSEYYTVLFAMKSATVKMRWTSIACSATARQTIRNETQLTLHSQFHMQRRSDTEDGEQKCGICKKLMVSRFQLNVHLMEHDNRRCCPHCLRPFALAQQLLSHVAEEHKTSQFFQEKPLHSCEICDETFRFAIQLENHVLQHVNETKNGRDVLELHMQIHKGNLELGAQSLLL
ncbi:unnamed protein product [Nippostrongylus brasiliensis]|uniref:Putative zinc finger protein (inferred by orthology to a C. elegans protein) n=1 Tax=Nippostrongylus brasiliensis TaxID=27835 RepID=A0A0N4XZ57_NIPBR|nr:unnamed protein product [Nippostrongylus brasiliensis]